MEKILPLLGLAFISLLIGLVISRLIWILIKRGKIIDQKATAITKEMEEVEKNEKLG